MFVYCVFIVIFSLWVVRWQITEMWRQLITMKTFAQLSSSASDLPPDTSGRRVLLKPEPVISLAWLTSCLQNSFYKQLSACSGWWVFLAVYQVIHYCDEVDIDYILTECFLHRFDSCELDKIFSLLSLILMLDKNWSRFIISERMWDPSPAPASLTYQSSSEYYPVSEMASRDEMRWHQTIICVSGK